MHQFLLIEKLMSLGKEGIDIFSGLYIYIYISNEKMLIFGK